MAAASESYTLNTIHQLYRKLRLLILLILICLVAALVMIFVWRALVFPLLAAALVLHLLLLRPLQKRYADAVTEANLIRTTCRYLGADTVPKKGDALLFEEILEAANLMPCGDKKNHALFRWEIRGHKNGMNVTLCDATIPQSFKLVRNGKYRVHFNAGVWMHITLPADSGLHFKLLDETSVPTPIRMEFFEKKSGYETADIGDPELGKRFVLYRKNDCTDRPTPDILKAVRSLVQYSPGYLAMSLDGDRMDLFLRGRFLSRAVSVSKQPSWQLLNFDPLPELQRLINIAVSTIK